MRLGRRQRSRRSERGFSIVEVVVGMLVFGISAVALYGGIMSGISTIRMARENQRATQILLGVMEKVRLYNWDQLNAAGYIPTYFVVVDDGNSGNNTGKPTSQQTLTLDGMTLTTADQTVKTAGQQTPSGLTYTGRITVGNSPVVSNYANQLKMVTVELVWRTGGVPRYRKLNTLVALDGLHSYIY